MKEQSAKARAEYRETTNASVNLFHECIDMEKRALKAEARVKELEAEIAKYKVYGVEWVGNIRTIFGHPIEDWREVQDALLVHGLPMKGLSEAIAERRLHYAMPVVPVAITEAVGLGRYATWDAVAKKVNELRGDE